MDPGVIGHPEGVAPLEGGANPSVNGIAGGGSPSGIMGLCIDITIPDIILGIIPCMGGGIIPE